MSYSLTLPWPPRVLHPNSRPHWSKLRPAAKRARRDAYILAQAAGARDLGWEAANVSVTMHPPNTARRDADGAFSALKASFDGIADATGIDDSTWRFSALVMGDVRPGGAVVVTIEKATA